MKRYHYVEVMVDGKAIRLDDLTRIVRQKIEFTEPWKTNADIEIVRSMVSTNEIS